jgi:6-phosphofructokinase 1
MTMQKIGVLTSGGDAPGMNAAIRAVVRTAVYYQREVVGVMRGFQGLIDGEFQDLDSRSVKHILSQGGTFLKSARSEEFRTGDGRARAFEQVQKAGIEGLVIIGGNGSFTGGHLFQKEYKVPVIGIPGTIDNDLYGTDFTLGYDSATNVVVECVDKIRDTASSHNRLFFVEVMGRDTGFIALRTAVATGALDVVLPEENCSWDDLLKEVERGFANRKTSNIIVTAEGNHLGTTFEIADRIKEHHPHIDTKVTILGHLQRGGAPSCYDRILASKLGVAAVEGLLNGKNDVMCGVVNNQVTFTFLQQAIKNKVPLNMELLRISRILSI